MSWKEQSNPFMDGSITSKPASKWTSLGKNLDPIYTLILSDDSKSKNILSFDNKKNFAFCVGINKLFHRKYVATTEQDNTISNDAQEISKTFINHLGFNSEQVEVRIASNLNDNCTKEGIHTSFLANAKKVEANGNFIFYFAGHGFEIQNRCILAPSNFTGDQTTGISGDDLVLWLNEAGCKARNVLFIFDCCYAGNIGGTLTRDEKLRSESRIFAMCGCACSEKVSSVSALGHSIFTYFLMDYLKTPNHNCKNEFNIQHAIEEIAILCYKLSFLIYQEDLGELRNCGISPILIPIDADIKHRSPGKHSNKIISSLESYLDEFVKENLHNMSTAWLQAVNAMESLKILFVKASTSKSLKSCIISIMIRSSALFHYIHVNDDDKKQFGSKNTFLLIAIQVFQNVDLHDLTMDHVIVGLEHYIKIATKRKIDALALYSLLHKMKEDLAIDMLNNATI